MILADIVIPGPHRNGTMESCLAELADIIRGAHDAEMEGGCYRQVLDLIQRRSGAGVVRLALDSDGAGPALDLKLPASGVWTDGVAVDIRWGGKIWGRLQLDIDRLDAELVADLDLITPIIGLMHQRDQRLSRYSAAHRDVRTTRAKLERHQRQLKVQHRDQWSTIIDLRAMLAAAQERPRPAEAEAVPGLVGESHALARARLEILRAARLDLPVLIEGESGTGKELAARAIHRLGPRSPHPLVRFDCAAVDAERVEAELFGYEAGAFSGATAAHKGVLLRAQGGTVLLDEVGERPPEFQAKLLRAVEGKSVRPLGGEARGTDYQVIATTRLDADAARAAGHIDQGLFYRLAVSRVRMPPLREHPEDIPQIIQHQLEEEGIALRIAPAVMDRLLRHPWPGNVRELRNLITRWILLAEDLIELDQLPPEVLARSGAADAHWRPVTLREQELELIQCALAQAHGDKTQAAAALGITRATLYAKLQAIEDGRP